MIINHKSELEGIMVNVAKALKIDKPSPEEIDEVLKDLD